MYLHHLTASHEAGERLERFFRWARGRRPAGGGFIPTTVLKSDGHIAIRLEIRDVEVGEVRVEDDAVVIKLSPRGTGIEERLGRA